MKKLPIKNILLLLVFLGTFLLIAELSIRITYGVRLVYEVDNELYWKLKPNQIGHPDFGLPTASINSDGFRGKEIPPPHNCNILVLGDSYSFGWGVLDNETYPSLLDAFMGSSTEVINAAIPGYGLFQENILFKRIYPNLNPDVVILLLNKHDLVRTPFTNESAKEKYLLHITLRKKIGRYSELSKFVSQKINRAFGTRLGIDSLNYVSEYQDFKTLWANQQHYIEEMTAILAKDNKKLYLILYPPKINNQTASAEFYNTITNSVGSNIVFIDDLDNANLTAEEAHISATDWHPSALAHQLIATRIYQEFQRANFMFNGKTCKPTSYPHPQSS